MTMLPPAPSPDVGSETSPNDPAELVRQTAFQATRRFQRMIPSLRSFARMMTRDPRVQVVMDHGASRTDGVRIFMCPPFELGEDLTHGRDCGERDEKGILRCLSCRTHEEIEVVLYHEVGHISFGSFMAVDDADRLELLQRLLAERAEGAERSWAAEVARRLEGAGPKTYMEAAAHVSPFLPLIVNALEDARVNAEMFRSRPGTYKMFRARYRRVIEQGLRQDDGSVKQCRDLPLNGQVLLGLLAQASGLAFTDWLDEKVVDAIESPAVCQLTGSVSAARSIRSIYRISLVLLEELQRLGFFENPRASLDRGSEEEADPCDSEGDSTGPGIAGSTDASSASTDDPGAADDQRSLVDDSSGSSEDDHGEPAVSNDDISATDEAAEGDAGSRGVDDPEEVDGVQDAPILAPKSDSQEDEGGEVPDAGNPLGDPDQVMALLKLFGGHGDDGEVLPAGDDSIEGFDRDALDQAVMQAIRQAAWFDSPSSTIVGVNEHRWGQEVYTDDGHPLTSGHIWRDTVSRRQRDEWGFEVKLDPSVLAPALARARIAFADNRKAQRARNQRSGRIDYRVLARRVPVDDSRLFSRRIEPGAKDYFVLLGLDISRSTEWGAITRIKAAGLHMSELLHHLGVPFAVYGHTGTPPALGATDGRRLLNLDIVVIKDSKERWTDETRERLVTVCPTAGNIDGHTLEYYRKVCDRQTATHKLVMYFTDGAMPYANFDEELAILQREIREAPRRGLTIVGVGVGTDSPTRHGLDTIRLDDVRDVPRVVADLERRLTAVASPSS